MSIAFLGLSLAVLFFILYKSGMLEELPRLLGRPPAERSYPRDPEEERRLEVFKDFFEGDSESE